MGVRETLELRGIGEAPNGQRSPKFSKTAHNKTPACESTTLGTRTVSKRSAESYRSLLGAGFVLYLEGMDCSSNGIGKGYMCDSALLSQGEVRRSGISTVSPLGAFSAAGIDTPPA